MMSCGISRAVGDIAALVSPEVKCSAFEVSESIG